MKTQSVWFRIGFALLPVLISMIISAGLILLVGRNPVEVFERMWEGAFRNERAIAGVLNFWIPLTLASLGLTITFRAGLWNIGIEGQMMAGAVGASFIPILILQSGVDQASLSQPLLILGSVLLGALAGMAWALLVGLLKTRLGVNEIFGGVALNALIDVFAIYLISGPWQPAIGGSAQATSPFPPVTLIPEYSADFPTSIAALIFTAVAIVAVVWLLEGTRWGLQLKAVGKNMRSALLLGVPAGRTAMSAFIACGALAGVAGSYRVLFTYDSLRPLASGNIGFLGLLVVLLVSMKALWVPLVTFFFAAILAGSTRLRVALQLDASLAGVLQGSLVLVTLLFSGLRQQFEARYNPGAVPDDSAADSPAIKPVKDEVPQ